MPTDYKTAVYNRLWQLLEGYAPLVNLIRVGNRLKLTTQDGWMKAYFMGATPVDFPSLQLSTGKFTNSAFNSGATFAVEDVGFVDNGDEWQIERTADFTLTVATQLAQGDTDLVEEAAQIALLKGGPKLGLSYVSRWGPMTATPGPKTFSQPGPIVQGKYSSVTVITFPVTMIFEGQDLVSQNT